MSDKPKLELMWDEDPETEHERLDNEREEALIDVAEAAYEACCDLGKPMHQDHLYLLVDQDIMNTLKDALDRYKDANENYINSVLGTTKEA